MERRRGAGCSARTIPCYIAMPETPKNVFVKHPLGTRKRYFGDRSLFNKWVDLLLDSKQGKRPHIPTFARKMLGSLSSVKVFHKSEATLRYDNLRTAELDNGQVVSIRFDTYRAHNRGYMDVEVLDTPRPDAAILAAMTAAAADPVDPERLREAFRCLQVPLKGTVRAHVEDEEIEPAADVKHRMSLSYVSQTLEYVLAMLRHYRPEFDYLSHQDQVALIEEMCGHVNSFLESLRTLQAFLAYRAPNRKLTPAIVDPRRDVRAAVLCDVDGMKHRQIGELMGLDACAVRPVGCDWLAPRPSFPPPGATEQRRAEEEEREATAPSPRV